MFRRRSIWLVLGVMAVLALSGWGFFKWHSGNEVLAGSEPVTKLGFTYLPVSEQAACCYGLTPAGSGAVVTSVTKGGALDAAGIQAGDVILSCNGVQVSQGCSLLGLIKSCPVGRDLTLSVYDGSAQKSFTLKQASLR